MKKIILNFCLILAFLFSFVPAYADDLKVLETVERYTQALKVGDVQEIKNLLGGRLYKKRRALLEENTEYSAWLRKNYASASFSFPSSVTSSDQYPGKHVVVVIQMENGQVVSTRFVLSLSDSGKWIIVDQVR